MFSDEGAHAFFSQKFDLLPTCSDFKSEQLWKKPEDAHFYDEVLPEIYELLRKIQEDAHFLI